VLETSANLTLGPLVDGRAWEGSDSTSGETYYAGDDKLRAVAARMGMQKAVERSQAYYISQQNAQYVAKAARVMI
jgi:hypothetical protein